MAIISMSGVTVDSGQDVVPPTEGGNSHRDDGDQCEESDEALDEIYRLPW